MAIYFFLFIKKDHIDALEADHRTAGRRSAGLPYGLLAVMLGAPRTVPEAFEKLFELSKNDKVDTTVIAAINTLQVNSLWCSSFCYLVGSNGQRVVVLDRLFEREAFFVSSIVLRTGGHHRYGFTSFTKLGRFVLYSLFPSDLARLSVLTSPRWRNALVRNVGLQLLGSLVKRGFDRRSQSETSIDHRESFSVWFDKYPELLPLFKRVLQEATASIDQVRFFLF